MVVRRSAYVWHQLMLLIQQQLRGNRRLTLRILTLPATSCVLLMFGHAKAILRFVPVSCSCSTYYAPRCLPLSAMTTMTTTVP